VIPRRSLSKSAPAFQFTRRKGCEILGISASPGTASKMEANADLNQPLIAGGGGRIRGRYDDVPEGIHLRCRIQIRHV
jgi:hypothetical protein